METIYRQYCGCCAESDNPHLAGGPSNELSSMTTTCGATDVSVSFDESEVADMDASHLHAGVDPTIVVCQATVSNGQVSFNFGLNECDPAVVVR